MATIKPHGDFNKDKMKTQIDKSLNDNKIDLSFYY